MIQNVHILISKLKQQHKHGTDPDPKKKVTIDEAAKKQIEADITNITKAMEAGTGITEKYQAALASLNTQNLQLQRGILEMTQDMEAHANAMIASIKAATFLEQRNAELNSSFGITSAKAAELGEKYDEIGESLKVGGSNVRKYAQSIDKLLPGLSSVIAKSGEFGEKLIAGNAAMVDHLGLSQEQAQSYQLYAAGLGKTAIETIAATDEMAKSFEKTSKMTGVLPMALKEIADLGGEIQMNYRKFPGMLEKSVVKAKLLGTSFKAIEQMATNMLNIEESVGKELEYQLLSGKRLVNQQGESITENMRIAKLSGNSKDMVKAMNDLLLTQGEILDGNNHYAKQELANLTGFTVDQLSNMKQARQLLSQSGFTEEKLGEIMELDDAAFETKMAEIAKNDVKAAELLKGIRAESTIKTTDQLAAEFYTMAKDKGIKVMMGTATQTGLITGTRKDVTDAEDKLVQYANIFQSKELATLVGRLQNEGSVILGLKKPIDDLVAKIPLFSKSFEALMTTINQGIANTYALKDTPSTMPVGPIESTSTVSPKNNDAILVNDGIVQFNKNDKFAMVPDGAAVLASTSTGALQSSVDTMMGSSKNSDANAIATAIVAALSNMKMQVNYNPLAAQEQLGFKLNQSINGPI